MDVWATLYYSYTIFTSSFIFLRLNNIDIYETNNFLKEDKFMLNKEEMERRYSIISEFCKKYRKELTEYGGKMTNEFKLSDSQSYIDFMNEKSEDIFVGNYLVNLFNDTVIQEYEDVLNEKRTIEDLFDEKWKSLL